MIIIGSTALLHNLGHLNRHPVDIDVFADEAELTALQHIHNIHIKPLGPGKFIAKNVPGIGTIEFELFESSESARGYREYIKQNPGKEIQFLDQTHIIAPNEVLYSIKRSHRHYPRNFYKHINDYHLLKEYVPQLSEELQQLTKIREKETEIRYGKLKTPSLMKNKENFFTEDVKRVFVHDDIHKIMAILDKPMYEKISKGDGSVASDKNKFFALPFQHQIFCVLEEAYVIALERCIIPMIFKASQFVSPEDAFNWALMRICTTLTSGWFRDFATENWKIITNLHNRQYVEKFFGAYQDGQIQRINQK